MIKCSQDCDSLLKYAGPLRAPNWIIESYIDATRHHNGCGGCTP